jgi:hypothetical protein
LEGGVAIGSDAEQLLEALLGAHRLNHLHFLVAPAHYEPNDQREKSNWKLPWRIPAPRPRHHQGETPMSTPKPPTVPLPPGFAALMALATPRIHAFATEISRLPPEDQTKRIAKVLAAMRGDP